MAQLCIFETPTKTHAVKWKTMKADFLPWKAEIPLSCNGEQSSAPALQECFFVVSDFFFSIFIFPNQLVLEDRQLHCR